ncbi:MAG: amino acid ABC transporter permease [Acetobacteraceae bacterium]|jgi:polar amino acid transport system permease protein
MFDELAENFFNLEILAEVQGPLLRGLAATIGLAAILVPSGLAGGLAIAVLHTAGGPWMQRWLAAWIDFFRAFPPLVLLLYVYFGLPMIGQQISPLWAVELALTLNSSSYFAEIFRAGIASVPHGQWEASRSLGLSWIHTLALVVLPQGLRAVLPDIVSNVVTVTQLTALASVVTLPELLHAAMVTSSSVYNATPLIAAGAGYLALLWPGIVLVNRLERRRRPVGNIPPRDPGRIFRGR